MQQDDERQTADATQAMPTAKASRARKRRVQLLAIAVIGLGIAAPLTHASVFWETFDNLFMRSRGWKQSDGAYSMALPPATGTSAARTLWMFGDTVLWMRNVIQPASSTQ